MRFREVHVKHSGEPCLARWVPDALAHGGQRLMVEQWGEVYALCCPFVVMVTSGCT
jgi:hypothetical protein